MRTIECTNRNHFALGGHVCRSIAQPQSSLQGVERRLQFRLLLDLWRLVRSTVVAKLGQLTSSAWDRVVRCPVLQPRSRPTNPLEKLVSPTNKQCSQCLLNKGINGLIIIIVSLSRVP